ncbi:MAG: hypothetical protein ACJ754_25745 [Pyrinomonadaceae bacterium]
MVCSGLGRGGGAGEAVDDFDEGVGLDRLGEVRLEAGAEGACTFGISDIGRAPT